MAIKKMGVGQLTPIKLPTPLTIVPTKVTPTVVPTITNAEIEKLRKELAIMRARQERMQSVITELYKLLGAIKTITPAVVPSQPYIPIRLKRPDVIPIRVTPPPEIPIIVTTERFIRR